MAVQLRTSVISLHQVNKFINPLKPIPAFVYPRGRKLPIGFRIMNSSSAVPGTAPGEMDKVVGLAFDTYSSNALKRKGNKGTAIVWFRNDLRILDNEALFKAWISSDSILPVYCVDPRLFHTTYHFGFPKTGGNHLSNFFYLLMLYLIYNHVC